MSKRIISALRQIKSVCYPGWSGLEFIVEFDGQEVLRRFKDTGVSSFKSFAVGQAKDLVQCDDIGKVVGENILMHLRGASENPRLDSSNPCV